MFVFFISLLFNYFFAKQSMKGSNFQDKLNNVNFNLEWACFCKLKAINPYFAQLRDVNFQNNPIRTKIINFRFDKPLSFILFMVK